MAQPYLVNIPSIRTSNPGLPPLMPQNPIDLNREIVAGQPIDIQNLEHARHVAQCFQYLASQGDPLITPEIAESARVRMLAVEAAHVSAAYPALDVPHQLHHQLHHIDQNLQQFNDRLNGIENGQIETNNRLAELISIVNANTANFRIISYNSTRSSNLQFLQKTIPGHGYAKALAVCPPGIAIQQPLVAAAIGDVPPPFQDDVPTFSHAQILNLILFYNDDFGIVPGEVLSDRQKKVGVFLTARV